MLGNIEALPTTRREVSIFEKKTFSVKGVLSRDAFKNKEFLKK
jgi:hypothetical protein